MRRIKFKQEKTYAHKVLCQLYNEKPFTVTLDDGNNASGSLDEKLSKGLIEGHPFIMWENVRGLINSQMAESAIRGTGTVPCRIPYMAPVEIPTDKVIWLLSSNKADVTPDLSARSLITRLRKQTKGYRFRKIRQQSRPVERSQVQLLFLSFLCFLVIRHGSRKGRPRTSDRRHDFSEACQVLDWIVQNVFKCSPLLDDHENEQSRISNPLLNWLRDVALAVEKEKKLEICSERVKLPKFAPITRFLSRIASPRTRMEQYEIRPSEGSSKISLKTCRSFL